MTAIIRREIRRRVGAFSQGGGVYRRPVFISRAYSVAVSTGLRIVSAGAGEIVVQGHQPLPGPLAGAGRVVVEGHTVGILTDGVASVAPAAGVIEVVGNRPVTWIPRRMVPLLQLAIRRRDFVARYAHRYPLPDYDVIIAHTFQPPAYRIVQAGLGEVVVEGLAPSILADAGRRVEVGAGTVVVEGAAADVMAAVYAAAGAAVVLVEGWQAKSTELENNPTPGAGEVVVLGYNPTVTAVGAYYRQGQQSSSWEAQDTAVQSWGDVVVVTTIWTKQ